MSTIRRPQSLAEIVCLFPSEGPSVLDLVKEFVFAFAQMGAAERQAALDVEPPLTGEGVVDAYLAAVAETVAVRTGLRTPRWVAGPHRFLRQPWYAGGMERIKPILLVESPSAFRIRNLFVSANVLDRPGFQVAMNEFQGSSISDPSAGSASSTV